MGNHGSNGYYQLIFTDEFHDLVKSKGRSAGIEMSTDVKWQNASQNGDAKVKRPTDTLTLYTNSSTAGTYTPKDDVQIGNSTYSSSDKKNRVSIKTQPKQTPETVTVTSETVSIDHTGSTQAHTWIDNKGKNQTLMLFLMSFGQLSLPVRITKILR